MYSLYLCTQKKSLLRKYIFFLAFSVSLIVHNVEIIYHKKNSTSLLAFLQIYIYFFVLSVVTPDQTYFAPFFLSSEIKLDEWSHNPCIYIFLGQNKEKHTRPAPHCSLLFSKKKCSSVSFFIFLEKNGTKTMFWRKWEKRLLTSHHFFFSSRNPEKREWK